jgi:hypothetical protein
VAQDPIAKAMLRAGRSYLNANLRAAPGDYEVKQAMARAAPTHTAEQQERVINALKQEFRKR